MGRRRQICCVSSIVAAQGSSENMLSFFFRPAFAAFIIHSTQYSMGPVSFVSMSVSNESIRVMPVLCRGLMLSLQKLLSTN